MRGALKVVGVMLAVPLAYSVLLLVFGSSLALWGALFVAGLLGMSWFHRARQHASWKPYIIIWILLAGAMWYASKSDWCLTPDNPLHVQLPALFCPFPQQ